MALSIHTHSHVPGRPFLPPLGEPGHTAPKGRTNTSCGHPECSWCLTCSNPSHGGATGKPRLKRNGRTPQPSSLRGQGRERPGPTGPPVHTLTRKHPASQSSQHGPIPQLPPSPARSPKTLEGQNWKAGAPETSRPLRIGGCSRQGWEGHPRGHVASNGRAALPPSARAAPELMRVPWKAP